MFDTFKGYTHITEKITPDCTIAVYSPKKGKGKGIIAINTYNKNTIYLYNTTLITITNNLILKLLNTLPKIKNKRVSTKRNKK